MVLPETDLAGAVAVAERLRGQVAAARYAEGTPMGCTASVGVSASAGAGDYGEWLRRADQALYRAKQAGRNRTEPYQG
jgi:diguanylate cyclase (GGDEF)-like protein